MCRCLPSAGRPWLATAVFSTPRVTAGLGMWWMWQPTHKNWHNGPFTR